MCRSKVLLTGLLVIFLLAPACGDDDDGALERSADANAPETDPADDGNEQVDDTGDAPGDPSEPPDAGDAEQEDPDGAPSGPDEPTQPTAPPGPLPELTGEEICNQLPAEVAAAALGVDSVTAAPKGSSGTPQCAYAFEGADGVASNATVAVLRPDEDLDGREGEEAYRYTVELNRRAASGADFEEIPMSVGDEAVLFDSESLRMGVIRYGRRIVTVLVSAGAAGTEEAIALAEATDRFAP